MVMQGMREDDGSMIYGCVERRRRSRCAQVIYIRPQLQWPRLLIWKMVWTTAELQARKREYLPSSVFPVTHSGGKKPCTTPPPSSPFLGFICAVRLVAIGGRDHPWLLGLDEWP
ncbi:hypothetical protein ACLOJK_016792 [Asimina triloba]